MTNILQKKSYPLNYPSDVTKIIKIMSFSKGKQVDIVGSMSLKSQQYAGDYDMFEEVNSNYTSNTTALNNYVKRFQKIIKSLNTMDNVYIGDIKAGEIKEWDVMKNGLINIKKNIEILVHNNIIKDDELPEIKQLLKSNNEDELRRAFKFHIVRWTPNDIANGFVILRDGSKYTLQMAFTSPSIIKLDVIGLVQNNRYTDFSIIYRLKNKEHVLNNFKTGNEISDLKDDIKYYYSQGNYFKALKRLFSLVKRYNNNTLLEKLNTLLNGDLGRIYSVLSDISTLQYLLDNETHLPMKRIHYELDQFRARLGNVYSLSPTDKIVKQIVKGSNYSKGHLEELLEEIQGELEDILSKATKQQADKLGVFPLPKKYL